MSENNPRIQKIYDEIENVDDFNRLSALYLEIARLHEQEGDFKKAYENRLIYRSMREAFLEEVKKKNIEIAEHNYQVETSLQEVLIQELDLTEEQITHFRNQLDSGFIFNSLEAIRFYIKENRPRLAEDLLAKFAHVIRKNLEILQFPRISLEKELEYLMDYLNFESDKFKGKVRIQLHIHPGIEEDITLIPPMYIQKFISSLLGQSCLNSRGEIHIKFEQESDNCCTCLIRLQGFIFEDNLLENLKTHIRSRNPFLSRFKIEQDYTISGVLDLPVEWMT